MIVAARYRLEVELLADFVHAERAHVEHFAGIGRAARDVDTEQRADVELHVDAEFLIGAEQLALHLQLYLLENRRQRVGEEGQLSRLYGAIARLREIEALHRRHTKKAADVNDAILACLEQLSVGGVDGDGLELHISREHGHTVRGADRAECTVPFRLDVIGLLLVQWPLHGQDAAHIGSTGEEATVMMISLSINSEAPIFIIYLILKKSFLIQR